MVLCNGPGTCVPVCAAAYVPRVLGLHAVQVVYVESVCRVETLSLSARLLYPFADQLYVQWPGLLGRYPRARYVGRIS